MTSDLDTCTSANELIKQQGGDAPIRAGELLEAGDMDGVAVWKRILAVVDELLSENVPDDATVITIGSRGFPSTPNV